MNTLDFFVLFGTMLTIVAYGIWKTRGSKGLEGYLLGDNSMKWGTIGLSVMATQASAITFLSTPGQGYEDGMGFVQFYFGMPFAMIIISVFVVPLYHKMKVYTAYEFLENRFDLKSRALAAFLFLVSRGLAAGITIYAPAIILSSILAWDINVTILIIGILVIIYTVSGGTKAVAETQRHQMFVIMAGMVVAFIVMIRLMPEDVGFLEASFIADKMGKMNAIDLKFDPSSRYNVWSGLTAALFLFLAYFGTDQSQVQRYLSGKSVKEIRIGLMFNGILKVPMQYSILLVGIMVFVFYQFTAPPIFFNQAGLLKGYDSQYKTELLDLEAKHLDVFKEKREVIQQMLAAENQGDPARVQKLQLQANKLNDEQKLLEDKATVILQKVDPDMYEKDSDYIFITFVMNYLPHGIIGLLMAVIFSAAMSSTSSELSALGSTTTIDFYKRLVNKDGADKQNLLMSRLFTVFWGILALLFAIFASQLDNLIQAVNILGSVFYGPILGIFIVAFAVKYVKGNAVFIATVISEVFIIALYFMTRSGSLELGYLWFNPIGALLVVFISMIVQIFLPGNHKTTTE
jgi:solute:Na+ symporter, SSS family